MSYFDELLALARAKGMDTEQLIKDIELSAATMACHPEYIAQALLALLKADWSKKP